MARGVAGASVGAGATSIWQCVSLVQGVEETLTNSVSSIEHALLKHEERICSLLRAENDSELLPLAHVKAAEARADTQQRIALQHLINEARQRQRALQNDNSKLEESGLEGKNCFEGAVASNVLVLEKQYTPIVEKLQEEDDALNKSLELVQAALQEKESRISQEREASAADSCQVTRQVDVEEARHKLRESQKRQERLLSQLEASTNSIKLTQETINVPEEREEPIGNRQQSRLQLIQERRQELARLQQSGEDPKLSEEAKPALHQCHHSGDSASSVEHLCVLVRLFASSSSVGRHASRVLQLLLDRPELVEDPFQVCPIAPFEEEYPAASPSAQLALKSALDELLALGLVERVSADAVRLCISPR